MSRILVPSSLVATLAAGLLLPAANAAGPLSAGAANTVAIAPAASQSAPGLADGRALLEKSIDAMGGREAFKQIRSAEMDISLGTPNGPLPINARMMPPEMVSITMSAQMPNPVEVRMVRNGEATWMEVQALDIEGQPVGERQVTPRVPRTQMDQFATVVRIHWMMHRILEDYETLEVTGIQEFEGMPCMKVRIADPRTERGREEKAATPGDRFVFVDLAEGFPRGLDAPVTGSADQRQVLAFRDVKEFGRLKLFTKMVGIEGPVQQTFSFDRIEFNGLLPGAFTVPEGIPGKPATVAPAAAPIDPTGGGRPINPTGRPTGGGAGSGTTGGTGGGTGGGSGGGTGGNGGG
ncbi:MAG: hypothetical protein AB8G96_12510 [Phycisphaerales bacterium]